MSLSTVQWVILSRQILRGNGTFFRLNRNWGEILCVVGVHWSVMGVERMLSREPPGSGLEQEKSLLAR